jgi:hypothetical protein
MSAVPADEGKHVNVETDLYRVDGRLSGETALKENFGSGKAAEDAELKKAMTLFTDADLKIDDGRLIAGEKGWTWNNEPLRHSKGERSMLKKGLALIMSPEPTRVALGGRFAVEVESDRDLEYFEKAKDGRFDLRKIREETGFKIGMCVEKGKNESIRLSDFSVSLKTVESREPVPGVNLPVGKPIYRTREIKTDILLSPGKNYGILFHPGEGQGILLLRLRATYAPPPQESEPNNEKNTDNDTNKETEKDHV